MTVGERFNFPTKAFSALALATVPGSLRHSVVSLASHFDCTADSRKINDFLPFSHLFQSHTCSSPPSRAADNSIILMIGD